MVLFFEYPCIMCILNQLFLLEIDITMKRVIFYVFVLSVAFLVVGGIFGLSLLTKLMFLSSLVFGFLSLFVFIRQTYQETSRAAMVLKTETNKAFNTFRLSYRLESLRISKGARQLQSAEKKAKILLRLIKQRFAERSLTAIRFRQEVTTYAQKIAHNLEMVVNNKESLASIDPSAWRNQIQSMRKAGAPTHLKSVQEIQRNLDNYDQLGIQYKELLTENDELLTQMDQAILALSRENHQLFVENDHLFTGEDAFINKFLHYKTQL